MRYEPKVGRISPLWLRDTLLDYVLGVENPATIPMWEYYGAPRNLFLEVDDDRLLSLIYSGTEYAKAFFQNMLLAMETLQNTFREFYGRRWEDSFAKLRQEILQERRCMLYFKLIAWLSIDGEETPKSILPQLKSMKLTYGLVTQYPEPILHTASCYACYEHPLYVQALRPGRWSEIIQQANELVASDAMDAGEPCPEVPNPYEYEEQLEMEKQPVSTQRIDVLELVEPEECLGENPGETLLETTTQALSSPCWLRQSLLAFLQQLIKWLES